MENRAPDCYTLKRSFFMRKLVALLSVACLLSGCASSLSVSENIQLMEGTVGNSANLPPEKFAVQSVEEQMPVYTVEKQIYSDEIYDEDGTLLASCEYEVPQLVAWTEEGTAWTEENETVSANLETFNSRFTKWLSGENFEEKAQETQSYYKERKERGETDWPQVYRYELSCDTYTSDDLISIAASYYSYSGGGHGMSVLLAWNYDLSRQSFIDPMDVVVDQAAFSVAVTQEILSQIDATNTLYWDDYEEIVAHWPSYAVSFGTDGMDVGFSPYELAAYAAGEQKFHISKEFLEPYLSDYGRGLIGYAGETKQANP